MPRIIISLPIHPILFITYLFIVLPLIFISQFIVVKVFVYLGLSLGLGITLSFTMFYLSLLLSPFNIVIKELRTDTYIIQYETQYILFYGIPIPVIGRKIVENKILITLNIGGALIPLVISLIMFYRLLLNMPAMTPSILEALLITAVITYIIARPIPGVGIAVPMFIPPLVAVTSSLILVGSSKLLAPIAYIAGTLGSLIGADILRLMKDKEKIINTIGPSVISIGGAGTFDGIYLSGLLAMILAFMVS